MTTKKPIIALTMGDAAGVGPEILIKALHEKERFSTCIPLLVGSTPILHRTAAHLGLQIDLYTIQSVDQIEATRSGFPVLECIETLSEGLRFGKPDAEYGNIAYQAILLAVALCQRKEVAAMVTAPICKESLHLAGHFFDGHTGLIAHLTQTTNYRMLFAAEKLKALHVTAHLSLIDACHKICPELVYDTILLGYQHLKMLGTQNPRIAVCGLNPHAGENGIFGREDIDQILPAVKKAQSEGIDVQGPLPADTTFMRMYRGEFDLAIAQYHDQGHVPGKLIAFDTGVNVTVGLPIIRTSVDHGTAFDIGGSGKASYTNLFCALDYALNLAKQ